MASVGITWHGSEIPKLNAVSIPRHPLQMKRPRSQNVSVDYAAGGGSSAQRAPFRGKVRVMR